LTIGRKGQATRFDFDLDVVSAFIKGDDEVTNEAAAAALPNEEDADSHVEPLLDGSRADLRERRTDVGDRVFITHGKNKKILEQVKQLVAFGKFEPIVAQEHETTSKPVPERFSRICVAARPR
jgi:hypothetical protein